MSRSDYACSNRMADDRCGETDVQFAKWRGQTPGAVKILLTQRHGDAEVF